MAKSTAEPSAPNNDKTDAASAERDKLASTGQNGQAANFSGQPVYDKKGNEPSNPVDGKEGLRSREKEAAPGFSYRPGGGTSTPAASGNNGGSSSTGGQSLYTPNQPAVRPGGLSSSTSPGRLKFSDLFSTRKRKAAGGGIVGAIIVSLVIGFMTSLPLELVHIKNVFYTQVGGVQSRTYRLGRQKYYSRMFFFDESGNFSGYKKQGIRGMMYQNRQTKAMLQTLQKNGYQVEFEKINNKETGRIKSLKKVDDNGKVVSTIASSADLERAWDIKKTGVLPDILNQVYPDQSARWNGRQAKKLYKRWGLTRTNWIGDFLKKKTGVTALEQKELIYRAALRQHLFGISSGAVATPSTVDEKDKSSTNSDIKDAADQTTNSNELASATAKDAVDERASLLESAKNVPIENTIESIAAGEASDLSAEDITKDAAKAAPGSVVGALSVFGASDKVCSAKGALDSVVIGARVLRASQLMRFGMSVLNIADAVQNGKAVSTKDVDIMMSQLNSTDANGHTMFASSGWRYWTDPSAKNNFSFSKYDIGERNKYSVGGGFTGTLAAIDGALNQYKLNVGCKKIKNPFVQVAGFAVGIGAGILSGGTFTVVNGVVNLGAGIVSNVALNVATEMLTPIVAGTVVNGAEHGTAIGNSLVSGLEVLSNANGANAGMMPLTKDQYKVALADVQNDNQQQLAQMSLKDRLFSTQNEHSVAMMASTNLQNINMASIIKSPFSSIASLFNKTGLIKSASADDGNNGCTDPDIKDMGLAATPFCNVEVGIPDSMINDPNYYPDVVDQKMIASGDVDEDGNPLSSAYKHYLNQCTSAGDSTDSTSNRSIDIIHESNQNQTTKECMDNPLFAMYRFYTYIGQTENDGLTGNNISDNTDTTVTQTTASTDSNAPISGDAKSIASQILQAAAAKKVIFTVLNAADQLDQSTPEANIISTSKGQPAHTTSNCLGRGATPPTPTVALNTDLLKFILELSSKQTLEINALAGQCHTNPTSNHYQGKAVDFDCPFDTTYADQIGTKYGVKRNSENCSADAHYHYSIGGN